MRRVLCLYLPYLSTDRVRRDGRLAPGDADRPLVLTRRVGASVFVAQRCARAREGGVDIGASLAQAQATLANAVATPEDVERDRQLLWQLARWALRFSPSVQPLEPNLLLVDVTGCQRLFGGERNIAQQAVGGLARLGLGARAAIADTIGAAYALATADFAGCVVVPPGQSSAYLAPLPPATLRIDARTQEQLGMLGVRTIGDLLTLPRSSLPARFGRGLPRRLRQALGEKHEPLVAYEDRPPPFTRVAFEAPVSEPRAVQPVAEQMLQELSQQVQQRELGVRALELVVYFEQVPPTTVTVNLSRASQAWEHMWSLLAGRLEQVDLVPGVTGMMLTARRTSRWQPHQGDLFERRDPAADEALGCLVDRLANRLGHAAIVRPQLVDDHQPEFAFRYVPVATSGSAPAGSNGVAATTRQQREQDTLTITTIPRPTRLLPRPVPIRVIALVPDGPPTWFQHQGHEHVVARAHGPERFETAWWRGPDVRRDYYRVLTEGGEEFWLFRVLDEKEVGSSTWYLHGVFA